MNYYEELNVAPDAPFAEVEQAIVALQGGCDTDSKEGFRRFKELRAMLALLRDAGRRAAYNLELRLSLPNETHPGESDNLTSTTSIAPDAFRNEDTKGNPEKNKKPPSQGLSEAERERRLRRLTCFNCGQRFTGNSRPDYCSGCKIRVVVCPNPCGATYQPLRQFECETCGSIFSGVRLDAISCPTAGCQGAPKLRNETQCFHCDSPTPLERRNHWATFRGNNQRTGQARLPLSLPLRFLWQQVLPHQIQSSPVTANGFVYIGTLGGEVHAFDRNGGSIAPREHEAFAQLPGEIIATPVYHAGTLYVASRSGHVRAIDALSGDDVSSPRDLDAGVVASLLIHQGLLIVLGLNGRAYALDARTLRTVWTFPDLTTDLAMPFLASPTVAGGGIIAVAANGCITMLEPTGDARWSRDIGEPVRSTPIALDNYLCVYAQSGRLLVFHLLDGEIRVNSDNIRAYLEASPASNGNYLYVGTADEHFHAQDFLTGRLYAPHFPVRNPHCREVDALMSSPAISSKYAFFGSDSGHLYGIDTTTGEYAWKQQLGGAVRSSPALDDRRLYVGCDNRTLYAFAWGETA